MKCLQSADFIELPEGASPTSSIKFVRGVDVGLNELLLNNPSVDSLLNYDALSGTVFWKTKVEGDAPLATTGNGVLASVDGVYSFIGTTGLIYIDSTGDAVSLPNGSNGDTLAMYNGAPAWQSHGPIYADIDRTEKLKIVVTASTITVTADKLTVTKDGGIAVVTGVSGTASVLAGGLGGLDTGTGMQEALKWYYIYVVSDGLSSGIILSLNKNKPATTFAPTYVYYRRVGAVYNRTTGSSLVAYVQRGNRVQPTIGVMGSTTVLSTGLTSVPSQNYTVVSVLPTITKTFVPFVNINARASSFSSWVAIQSITGLMQLIGIPPLPSIQVSNYGLAFADMLINDPDAPDIKWATAISSDVNASFSISSYTIDL